MLVLAGSGAVLFLTNPTREDYRAFAGQTLVTLATEEICERQTLPMVLQLWISDCPRLIADQEQALALLADKFTRRWNVGVASVYVTQVGGQNLLPPCACRATPSPAWASPVSFRCSTPIRMPASSNEHILRGAVIR